MGVPVNGRERSTTVDHYARLCEGFSWGDARRSLAGLPGGGINIGYEAVDRHAAESRDKTALRCVSREGVLEVSYGELLARTSAFANLLTQMGVGRGERVFSLLGRVPELYVIALGTLRHASAYSPLFAAFGPEPIRERLSRGDAAVLVTTPELYERRIEPIRDQLPRLRHVLVVGGDAPRGAMSLEIELSYMDDLFEVPPTDPQEIALLHFSSGTTGRPKGAVHVHEAVVAHRATAQLALDLRRDDVFWCTADPGWVTGTSYGIVAPLALGATVLVDAEEFDARRWYSRLAEHRVTVWYTAPTALRMLMRHPPSLPAEFDLSALRHVASVGEPLNPEVVTWGADVLGHAVHDNWWQTETGAIMISNFPGVEVRPGSMGLPVPGVEARLAVQGDDGRAAVTSGSSLEFVTEPDTAGEIVLRAGWPSMFRGYLHEDERYARSFAGDWYLTGDLARRDADGYFWFVGRTDDVIKSAGHLIGPFEVESVLMEHPAVTEAGVIGKPDPVVGEIVKAFVSIRPGVEATDDLRLDLLAFARRRLGAVAPKEIAFDDELPHTRSGKVMRRLLKARELGLPEGDLSTLETGERR